MPRAEEHSMALVMFFFVGIPAIVVTGVLVGPALGHQLTVRRVIRTAERSVGVRSRRRTSAVALATAAAWAVIALPLMTVSPTGGIWAGAAVVALGCSVIIARSHDTFSMDDEAFEVAVRELLDQP